MNCLQEPPSLLYCSHLWSLALFAASQGTYTFQDGSHFEGNFKNDRRHGKGVYTFASGSSYEGEWDMGRRVPGAGKFSKPGEDPISVTA